MSSKTIRGSNHVRYAVEFTRLARGGKRYTAMKTSIEVSDAQNEKVVRERISTAINREMHHDQERQALAEDVGELVWGWLQALWENIDPPITVLNGIVVCDNTLRIRPHDESDYVSVRVFTEKEEAEAEKLLVGL